MDEDYDEVPPLEARDDIAEIAFATASTGDQMNLVNEGRMFEMVERL